jgi:hypothetical protein
MRTTLRSSLALAVLSLTITGAFAVENADLAGSWNVTGPLGAAVRNVHGERMRTTGVMTFNQDGTCLLALNSASVPLPSVGDGLCGAQVCLPCTYTVTPARRFDVNWDDTVVDALAAAATTGLLGTLSEGATTDVEVERSAGILRPALDRIRIETAIKGVTTIPMREATRRFAIRFSLGGERAPAN